MGAARERGRPLRFGCAGRASNPDRAGVPAQRRCEGGPVPTPGPWGHERRHPARLEAYWAAGLGEDPEDGDRDHQGEGGARGVLGLDALEAAQHEVAGVDEGEAAHAGQPEDHEGAQAYATTRKVGS